MRPFRTHTCSRGFTLLETLIALVVLSIGLLGLASLQIAALKVNHQSYQRTQAVILASDIIDRIRANPTGKTAGYYDTVSTSDMPTLTAGQCITSSCNASQLAAFDIASWKSVVAKRLREGAASIGTTARRRVVTIAWKEDDQNMQIVVEADL